MKLQRGRQSLSIISEVRPTYPDLETYLRERRALEEAGPNERALIDAPEAELVRRILMRAPQLWPFFDFVVADALGYRRSEWSYFFAAEIKREWLGLPRGRQPGDIDVLIVPVKDEMLHIDKAAAIEVKRLVLRDGKIGRNADRYGVTQAHGLMRDGFPYVGVLHIVIAQSRPEACVAPGEIWRIIDDDGRAEKIGEIRFDRAAITAAQLQIKRLLTRECDPRIGINSVGMLLPFGGSDNRMLITDELGRLALPNPTPSRRLMANIAHYVRALTPIADVRD